MFAAKAYRWGGRGGGDGGDGTFSSCDGVSDMEYQADPALQVDDDWETAHRPHHLKDR